MRDSSPERRSGTRPTGSRRFSRRGAPASGSEAGGWAAWAGVGFRDGRLGGRRRQGRSGRRLSPRAKRESEQDEASGQSPRGPSLALLPLSLRCRKLSPYLQLERGYSRGKPSSPRFLPPWNRRRTRDPEVTPWRYRFALPRQDREPSGSETDVDPLDPLVAVGDQKLRDRVLDVFLDRRAERPRAHVRVVAASVREASRRGVVDVDHPPFGASVAFTSSSECRQIFVRS